jgi:hypothetical protein
MTADELEELEKQLSEFRWLYGNIK